MGFNSFVAGKIDRFDTELLGCSEICIIDLLDSRGGRISSLRRTQTLRWHTGCHLCRFCCHHCWSCTRYWISDDWGLLWSLPRIIGSKHGCFVDAYPMIFTCFGLPEVFHQHWHAVIACQYSEPRIVQWQYSSISAKDSSPTTWPWSTIIKIHYSELLSINVNYYPLKLVIVHYYKTNLESMGKQVDKHDIAPWLSLVMISLILPTWRRANHSSLQMFLDRLRIFANLSAVRVVGARAQKGAQGIGD